MYDSVDHAADVVQVTGEHSREALVSIQPSVADDTFRRCSLQRAEPEQVI